MITKTAWYWQKNRHTDQWNRIESPEITPHVCMSKSFSTKELKTCNGGKKTSSIIVLANLESHMQNNETRIQLVPYTKINSKYIKDLNVRPETINDIEKNID